MPLAGLPVFLVESGLRRLGIMSGEDVSLLPLTNALLFALLGVLSLGIARRLLPDKQTSLSLATVVALVASPLLPASQTYYSEMPAAIGLAGLAWALLQPENSSTWCRWVAPILFPAVAMMACPAKTRLWLAGIGIGLGIAARLVQNAVLRGSPLAQGYDGQEFTTPIVTGLHGLLFSPERGLVLFYPILFWALFPFGSASSPARAFERLAAAVLAFSLVFHASFWTWHGGWTAGPRFLLPAVALGTPLVAILLTRIREFRPRLRLLLVLVTGWGALAALLYAAFNPRTVWNELWGFHQVESRWLYEPQFSLWNHWTSLAAAGEFHPLWLRWIASHFPPGYPTGTPLRLLTGMCFAGGIGGLLGAGWRWPAVRRWAIATAGVLALLGAAGLLSGERGWQTIDSPDAPQRFPEMRLDAGAQGGEFVTFVNLRPHGNYGFSVKSNGLYDVQLDDEVLFAQNTPEPQHLRRTRVDIQESGLRELRVRAKPQPGEPLLFRLYWTWPGEGRLLESVGGQYTQPRTLSNLEEAASALWRRGALLIAGWLALVLLLWPLGEVKRR